MLSPFFKRRMTMTVQEAIDKVDALKPNTYTIPEKLGWLASADLIVKHRVIDTHELNSGETEITDADIDYLANNIGSDTVLLLPKPYDDAYIHYLSSQIDYWNHEIPKYNNAMAMFNSALTSYSNEYHRSHTPKGIHKFNFFKG